MKTNYHTHTFRCKHAVGDDEAYEQLLAPVKSQEKNKKKKK